MKTQIFNTYEEFLAREDKTLNGVSPEFAALHPDYETSNNTNRGCWDCHGCFNCINCVTCFECENCEGIENLWWGMFLKD